MSLPVPTASSLGQAGFFGGLLIWFPGWTVALATLFLGYFFAECAERLVWLAQDTRRLREHLAPAGAA